MINNSSSSANSLKFIVLNTEFKNDPKLWLNPSLFCLPKDEKRIKKAISIIDLSIKFEDIIIFADNNASFIPNTDFVLTADGVYSKEHPFLAFANIKKVATKSFGILQINNTEYSLPQTKSFNTKSIAAIIEEYITSDNNNIEPNIDKLIEQANNQNVPKKSIAQKLAKGVLIFFFSIFFLSFLINLPDIISYQEEKSEKNKIREAKELEETKIAKQKERKRQEDKRILEAKLAQNVGKESFDEYNQLMSLSLVHYLLERQSSWTNQISLYQAKNDFTYKIDNMIDNDVNVKIKKYAYIIYAKEKDDRIIYHGKRYETDMGQLSKNCTLAFQRSNTENFAKFFADLDKEVLMTRNILSNVQDVDMAIVKREYIDPQEKMMKRIRYNLETSKADKFINSIKLGDIVMALVGLLFIFYFLSFFRKSKFSNLSGVGLAMGDGIKNLGDGIKNLNDKNKKKRKSTPPEDKLIGRAYVKLDNLSYGGNRVFDIIQKADGSFFVKANSGDYNLHADTKPEIDKKIKSYIEGFFGKIKGYEGVEIKDI